jgi:hypothetical protein
MLNLKKFIVMADQNKNLGGQQAGQQGGRSGNQSEQQSGSQQGNQSELQGDRQQTSNQPLNPERENVGLENDEDLDEFSENEELGRGSSQSGQNRGDQSGSQSSTSGRQGM